MVKVIIECYKIANVHSKLVSCFAMLRCQTVLLLREMKQDTHLKTTYLRQIGKQKVSAANESKRMARYGSGHPQPSNSKRLYPLPRMVQQTV